ncbi:hypothetical protein GCM10010294_01750 [Streptomyces griseoloalbus]|nr:hypothetical protein GCM10010294_01750 [Streptomyces griseoloalbus]
MDVLNLTRHIGKVTCREVVDMARRAAVRGRLGAADALFLPCPNLPTYDVIPQLEAELRIRVISANQVTMWAALRRLGTRAVGPYQALIDASARSGTVLPGRTSGAVLPGRTSGPYCRKCRKRSSRKAGHDRTGIPLPGPLRRGRLSAYRAVAGQRHPGGPGAHRRR